VSGPHAQRAARRDQRHSVHVHLDPVTRSALGEFAERQGLTTTASVRLLVERGLAADNRAPAAPAEEASFRRQLNALGVSTLACLIAVEQNHRLLISMLPDGADKADELWEEAATSARERLIRVDAALAEESA